MSHIALAPEPKSAPPSALRISPPGEAHESESGHAQEKTTEKDNAAWSLSKVGLRAPGTCAGSCQCEKCRARREGGEALEGSARTDMEQRFGRDFGDVRVHTGPAASRSAASAGAGAYTVGNDIVFGSGFFSPQSQGGRSILAHELAHVSQQSGAPGGQRASSPAAEAEARTAGDTARRSGPIMVGQRTAPGFAALSLGEARQALWSHVPEGVKDYVRPAAKAAAAEMDKVIPPDTQIPKPIEDLARHPIDTAIHAAEHPIEAAKTVVATAKEVAPVASSVAKKVVEHVKTKAKQEIHDTVMKAAGKAKGVVLEATNIVDTVAWVPYAVHEVEQRALGDSDAAKHILAASDAISGYASLNYLATHGYGAVDPITGKPTGALNISDSVSHGLDKGAAKLDSALGGGAHEQGQLFTSYEEGELEGAIGTQVALSFVGAEEVQLGLKALGLIGAVKGLVDAISANPKGWQSDPNFWGGILNIALNLVGLKSSQAAGKITKVIMAGGQLLTLAPVVMKLYHDYTKLPEGAERDKALKTDYGALIKGAAAIVMSVVHGAGGKKGPAEEPNVGGKPAPTAANENTPPPSHGAGPIEEPQVKAPADKPVVAEKPAVTEPPVAEKPPTPPPVAETPAEPPAAKAPGEKAAPKPAEKPVAQKPMEPPAEKPAHQPHADEAPAKQPAAHEEPKAVNKSDAQAEAPTGDGHEVVATKGGLGVCSPGPCPVIHVKYAKQLAESPALKARYEEIQQARKTDPKGAAQQAAELVKTLEEMKAAAPGGGGGAAKKTNDPTPVKAVPLPAEQAAALPPEHVAPPAGAGPGSPPPEAAPPPGGHGPDDLKFELGVGKKRAQDIQEGKKNFVVDHRLTFDIDEVLPVGARDIKPQRAYDRATSAENRQLLDPMTNRASKGLGIDPRELPSNRAPREPISVTEDPHALLTRRFSEVHELQNIFDQAAAKYADRRDLSATELKAAINKETRRIITEDPGPDAAAVRKALEDIGFEHVPGVGWALQKGPPGSPPPAGGATP